MQRKDDNTATRSASVYGSSASTMRPATPYNASGGSDGQSSTPGRLRTSSALAPVSVMKSSAPTLLLMAFPAWWGGGGREGGRHAASGPT
jgi:hypothetical protein